MRKKRHSLQFSSIGSPYVDYTHEEMIDEQKRLLDRYERHLKDYHDALNDWAESVRALRRIQG